MFGSFLRFEVYDFHSNQIILLIMHLNINSLKNFQIFDLLILDQFYLMMAYVNSSMIDIFRIYYFINYQNLLSFFIEFINVNPV